MALIDITNNEYPELVRIAKGLLLLPQRTEKICYIFCGYPCFFKEEDDPEENCRQITLYVEWSDDEDPQEVYSFALYGEGHRHANKFDYFVPADDDLAELQPGVRKFAQELTNYVDATEPALDDPDEE